MQIEMRFFLGFILFLVLVYSMFRSPLSFTKTNGGNETADYFNFNRKYRIEKEYSDGSGQYVLFTIFKLVNDNEVKVAEITTCGRFKVTENSIHFFLPHEFKCGLLTSFLDDWLNPKISRLEFTEDGEKLHLAR